MGCLEVSVFKDSRKMQLGKSENMNILRICLACTNTYLFSERKWEKERKKTKKKEEEGRKREREAAWEEGWC